MNPMITKDINSIFTFGKYKGQMIKIIALIDPLYIEWCCKEVIDFIISYEVIDQLSEFCLDEFFKDPEAYLNEMGNFTEVNWQYLKYKNNEITIGYISLNDKLFNRVKLGKKHISVTRSRLVFNGTNCKQYINKRASQEIENDDNNDYSIDMEDMRRSYNDAYEIDSNEFEGWYEPID